MITNAQDAAAQQFAQQMILQEIQQNAAKNPLRQHFTQAYNSSAQIQGECLQFVLDVGAFYNQVNHLPTEQAISNAAYEVMPIMVANFAVRNNMLAQLPPQAQTMIYQLIDRGNQLDGAIKQMYGQPQMQAPQPQYMTPTTQGPSWNHTQPQAQFPAGTQPLQSLTIDAVANATPNWNNAPRAGASGPVWETNTQTTTTPAPTPAPVAVEAPVDAGIRGKTALVRTWELHAPYPVVFDPRYYKLRYSVVGEIVKQIIEEKSPMDYSALETRKLNPNSHMLETDHGLVVTTWQLLGSATATDTPAVVPTDDKDVVIEGINEDNIPFYDEWPFSFTQESAELKLYSKSSVTDDTVWEMTYNRPMVIETKSNQIGFIEKAVKTKSVTDIVNALAEQFYNHTDRGDNKKLVWTGDGLGLGGWLRVVRYLTDMVNHALAVNVSLVDWSIGDIVEDWSTLLLEMQKQFGETLVDVFTSELGQMMAERLTPMRGKQLKALIAQYHMEPYAETFATKTLVLSTPYHVTSVPFTASSMQVDWDGVAGIVKASDMPEFYKAVNAIYKRAMKRNVGHRVMIKTEDQVLIEIDRAWLGNDGFLISVFEK